MTPLPQDSPAQSDVYPIETAPRDTPILAYGDMAGEIYGPYSSKEWAVVSYVDRSDYPGFNWSLNGADFAAVWMKAEVWFPLPAHPHSPAQTTEPS